MKELPKLTREYATYYVAYSGGLDSTVLLHWLWQQNLPVHAIHINHQLQAQAVEWAEHCAQQCIAWQIPYTVQTVSAHKQSGESPEAAARAARYAAFAQLMSANSVLCTAHHQDDQAETLLLQLIRGAGVAGLAAMPGYTPFATGHLWRPLLEKTRAELEQYAQQQQLTWIEDPSNQATDYDRNYLRHHIFPLLRARWPSVSATLARSAKHCAEAMQVLAEQAASDYQMVQVAETSLAINRLMNLSRARQHQVVRYWLEQQNLPLPSTAQMAQLLRQLQSRQDAVPIVHWPGVRVQRYRDSLYATKWQSVKEDAIALSQLCLTWDLSQPLELPHNLGTLVATSQQGAGLSKQRLAQAPITIRFRHGTLRCQPQGRAHSQTLKKLYQEYAIPPWQRNTLPLLFCGEELAAVIGHWICAPFAARADEIGWQIVKKCNAAAN